MKRALSSGSKRAALALSGVLVLGGAVSCGPGNGGCPGPSAEAATPASTGTVASEAPAPGAGAPAPAGPPASPGPAVAGLDRLVGRWFRPDGGYVLEVRSVSPEGMVDAAYLNPRPIHVARAEALREGGALTLFVELRDVNYPGSTYRLVYDPGRDVLGGLYFQALEQQTFDVEFVRR